MQVRLTKQNEKLLKKYRVRATEDFKAAKLPDFKPSNSVLVNRLVEWAVKEAYKDL